MKAIISKSEFRDAFVRCGRKENFSYEGIGELYDHLEAVDEDYELDVIALCCDYAEDEIVDVLREYGLGDIEDLREKTLVVWADRERVLYAQF